MKIFVKAKTGARDDDIEKIDETHFIVSVKERPVKGQANRGIIRVVANYFKVSKSEVRMVSGFTSFQKILEIKV